METQKRKRLSGPEKIAIVKRYLVERVPISYGSQLSLARQGLIARGLGILVGDNGW